MNTKKKMGRPAKIDDAVITHYYISKENDNELRRWAKLAGVSVAELTRTFIHNGLSSLNGEEVSYNSIRDKCKDRLKEVDAKLEKMKKRRKELAHELSNSL